MRSIFVYARSIFLTVPFLCFHFVASRRLLPQSNDTVLMYVQIPKVWALLAKAFLAKQSLCLEAKEGRSALTSNCGENLVIGC